MNRVIGWSLACIWTSAAAAPWTSPPSINVANGTVSNEWPAVGALILNLSGGGYEECTATLISPTWALTAAHCVQDSSNPADYVFIPQPDYVCCLASGPAVANIYANPAYNTFAHDQGLVQLATPVSGITPFMVNNQAPPGISSYLHVLGYGLTTTGNNSLKERGLVEITGEDSTTITYDVQPYAQACQGDSGAPSFNYAPNGFPIAHATVSFGSSATCGTSTLVVNSRTDSDIAWILSHATDACLRSGSGSCDGIFRGVFESLAIAPAAPVVTLQPANQTIPGEWFATFTVAASGDPPPTVQWQASPDGFAFADVPGATSTTATLYGDPSQSGLHLRAVFTNALGSVQTNDAVLTVGSAQDYNPANCAAVAGTLNIFWEAVGGGLTGCTGIEYTDGTLPVTTNPFSMTGQSVSDQACISPAAYTFTLSADHLTLSGADTLSSVPMTMTLSSDGGCFVGHWISGPDDYVGTLWNFVP